MLRLTLLLTGLTFSFSPAFAEFQEASPLMPVDVPTVQLPSADAMLSFCQDDEPGDWQVCAGYLRGVAEFQEFIWSGKQEPIFCLPNGWTESTMRPAVVSFISSNYESWQGRPALGAVIAALSEAFPCP